MNNTMKKEKLISNLIKELKQEWKLVIKEVPTLTVILFVIAVFSMNLLANKSLNTPFEWLALDCGLLVSWFVFLILNVVTMHFGPRASTMLSIFATLVNISLSAIFFVASVVPGTWGESYVTGSELIINNALDNTIGGTWYILLGSTVAFLTSAVVNNVLNFLIGKCFSENSNSKVAFWIRTNVATGIGQFVDNFVFAFIVSRVFFGWTIVQCITCAITGMIVELLCEMIFSAYGYKICVKWNEEEVGKEYLKAYGKPLE